MASASINIIPYTILMRYLWSIKEKQIRILQMKFISPFRCLE